MSKPVCPSCHRPDATTRERNCGYHARVHRNPNRLEVVCDTCEAGHLADLTCNGCDQMKPDVRHRACGYYLDVMNDPSHFETICDDCEREHCEDI